MSTRTRIIVGAICAIYIAARLWRLDASCLWFDEIFSVHAAEHDWGSLFSFVAQDLIHPPLFYLVLKFWIAIGGESVYWLRLLPVAFSVIAIFPFIRLCRELRMSDAVTLIALFLLAVNGSLIKYTQTLRMYSMLMFLSVLSLWLFARFFNRGKSFIWLVIANLLLVYTHYCGWLVVFTELFALMLFQRIKWRRAVVMTGVLAASFVPWLIAVLQAAQNGSSVAQNIAWQTRPALRELITFGIDIIEPFYFQASSAEPASIYVVSTPVLLLVLTMISLYVVEWQREEQKRSVLLLLIFAAFPFGSAFIASWLLPHSVWGTRHMIMILPPAMILIANAIWNFPVRVVSYIAVFLVVVLSAIGFVRHVQREVPQHVWCEWNRVAEEIRATDQPGKIYAFDELVSYHLWFALRDTDRFRIGVIKGIDVPTDDAAYFLPRGFDGVDRLSIDEVNDETMWLVFRNSTPGDNERIMSEFERRGYAVCNQYQVEAESTTAFWAQLRKGEGRCK
jgi:uncharacterized membrane protein